MVKKTKLPEGVASKAELVRRILAEDESIRSFEVIRKVKKEFGLKVYSGDVCNIRRKYLEDKEKEILSPVTGEVATAKPPREITIAGLNQLLAASAAAGGLAVAREVLEILCEG